MILNDEGGSLNHFLAENGLAWWDERNASKDGAMRKLSASAVVGQKGIFSAPAALAPWDYRKSHGIPDFTYNLDAPEPAPRTTTPVAADEEEPRSISAKGTMTEDRPRAAASATAPAKTTAATGNIPLSIPGIPDDMLKGVDVGDIMMRHQPHIAKDASGKPLGLAATNVGSIPGATQYGFQEGDIVSRVNGIAIESEAQIFSLVPQFMNVKNFQIEVLRNGQIVNIPISIK
jgi:hypothetical protein